MSDYTTRATVDIEINGEKAKRAIEEQKQLIHDLEVAYAKAAACGDKISLKKLNKDLKKSRKDLKILQSATMNVADVLRRLDKATPIELKNTLRQLNKELNQMERGSEVWTEQVKKIQAVKKELASVNSTLDVQRTKWQKMTDWINRWQTFLLGAVAGVSSIIGLGKKAVQSYADMEQEEANVRKYTGMTAEQVAELNEEFKKMDTRTSREGLNKLAQEAGRLGKTSKDDVLGFVRAADQINVALDDLGEGATLTLSKLTGIFGDEKRLGTEKSLLAVGSVINELSQNCSASAPYLAEFASRMGGVASQANMTIQQVMGFGAVLDSNNQKVEASATALSQVITRLYQDPTKYAKPAGLEVEKFTKLLKKDANSALIMLLESLNKMGNMDVLSPIFAEMGENGSRAISALSTLATHIDEVKAQQAAANIAFAEATSIGQEFNVQNNTVQAGLDKAKKSFNEIAIELGQKLMPIMKFVISSSSLLIRMLNTIIGVCFEYKGVLLTLTTSIIAYTVAINAAVLKTKALAMWQGIVKVATVAWTAVTYLSATAMAIFTGNVTRATIAFKAFSATLKLSPIGLLVGTITAVVAGLALWITRTKELSIAQKQQQDIEKKAQESSLEELTTLRLLYEASQDQNRSLEERTTAVQKLQEKYPDYFGNLSTEAILAGNAADEYERLTTSILNSARAKARQEQLVDNEQEILRLEQERDQRINEALDDMALNYHDENLYSPTRQNKMMLLYDMSIEGKPEYQFTKRYIDHVRETYKEKIAQYRSANDSLSKLVSDDLVKNEVLEGSGSNDGICPKCGKLPCVCSNVENNDRFKAEKEWREREETLNRISYATGEKNYEDYRKRIDEIAVEYYDKLKKHTLASADERLQFETQYYESLQKQQETFTTITLEEENARYNEFMAKEKDRYINGQTSLEAYNNTVALIELDHKRRIVQIYKVGTAERLKAEQDYQNALLQDKQRRRKETIDAEKKHQELLAKMKSEYFGDNPSERQAKYDTALSALTEVYNAELVAAGDNATEKLRIEEAFEKAKMALRKKYNIDSINDSRNALEKANDELIQWLNGDAGKAVTQSFDTVMSGMSAIFSQVSTIVQAELDMQTAAIEKRYEKEISQAEGNTYKVAKLEKQKEKEIAKAKNEANKKMFAMQVIQAVAQTATNAINAYGSAAAIPVVGFVMAPIAAAMAVAAGALQIAAIKKQQQASEAQGYASGGFTPKGGKYEPAGVVHKGEWVASQELLASPVARPMIEALDYAQRTNTIGSLKAQDVSRSITAPAVIASSSSGTAVSDSLTAQAIALAGYTSVIRRLNERLDEPFVTVNTVTGDSGIKKAQDEYEKLMRNKSRKSKYKSA